MHKGSIWTLEPPKLRDPLTGKPFKSGLRYMGYCDGKPCGMFHTKKEFDAFVNIQYNDYHRGPYELDAKITEALSTQFALEALDKFYQSKRQ
jgi:hypothetical protein